MSNFSQLPDPIENVEGATPEEYPSSKPVLDPKRTGNLGDIVKNLQTMTSQLSGTIPSHPVKSVGFRQLTKSEKTVSGMPKQEVETHEKKKSTRYNQLQKIVNHQTLLLNEILKNSSVIDSQIEELNSTLRTICSTQQSFESRNTTSSISHSDPIHESFNMGLFLSGELRVSFKFQLLLENYMDMPLYRQKNFSLKIKLVDIFGNVFENSNRIPLAISVYSPDNPPKEVEFNMSGNRMVKGFSEQDLIKGVCSFEKIQIKEVTSHFRKGWIYLVVSPKGFESRSSAISSDYVPSQAIKPLVIEKVIVKAKQLPTKIKGGPKIQQQLSQHHGE